MLPDSSQSVAFVNSGWKALAIGANTTANYPDSLEVNDLTVDAPADSFNQLLLNWAGLDVPLVVRSNLIVGTNGSLASHYSALRATTVEVSSSASFSDYATEDFGQLKVWWSAIVSLTNGTMTCSNLFLYGRFIQSGGTNYVGELAVASGGNYGLSGGQLVTSNTTVGTVDGVPDVFVQNGGSHTVQNRLLLQDRVRYSLSTGTLSAPCIEVGSGAELRLTGGTVSNQGMVVLRNGGLRVEGMLQQFGKLVLEGDGTLYVSSTNPPTVLRFQDSRDVEWSGILRIQNWSTNHLGYGPDHIFFGTNSQALTPDQLSRLIFVRPDNPSSDYSATITATGEVLPGAVQNFTYYSTTNGTITITRYTGSEGDVTIPNTINGLPVTTIGVCAFENCHNLTNVMIPNSVTTIGDYTFYGCTSLTNIMIPDSVTTIGDNVFRCDRLNTIIVDTSNSIYSSVNGVLFNKSQTTLVRYPQGKAGSYTIPNSVTSVGFAAFENCHNLTHVMIPNSVTTIKSDAFHDCTSLTAVYFRGNAPSVGSSVFFQSAPTIYYLPGTTGWGATFAGRPTAPWFLPNPLILDFGPSFGIQTNRFGFIISWATNVPSWSRPARTWPTRSGPQSPPTPSQVARPISAMFSGQIIQIVSTAFARRNHAAGSHGSSG